MAFVVDSTSARAVSLSSCVTLKKWSVVGLARQSIALFADARLFHRARFDHGDEGGWAEREK